MTAEAITDAAFDMAPGWVPAILQRRRALMQRLGLGGATAMIFSPVFGWRLSLAWLGLYLTIQLLDLWAFAPITGRRTLRMGHVRSAFGGLMMLLNAASFGGLSILLWMMGGAMGGVCAAILLASGAIYSTVNSPDSAKVYVLTFTPQVLYLATMPIFMTAFGASGTFVTAAAISIVIFAAYCITTWQRMRRTSLVAIRAREDAERRRAQAERAMASRSAFLAAVGHDLRTPISAILTGAEEMRRLATEGGSRANAALISDAALMMKAMLDDLLDHSKLDAGRMTVEAADFDLRALLAQTVNLWRRPVQAKGLALRIEGVREIPAMVRGDAMRLRQILNNLISNAVKFTTEGSITLRLRAWPEEPSGHAIVIEIADTGRGLTPEQLSRLFTPFDQTADGVSALHGGTGLGLSISRDLVKLMGGHLTARSPLEGGACFTVCLSLEQAEDQTRPIAIPALSDGRGDIALALAATHRVTAPEPMPEVAPAPVASDAPGTEGVDEGARPLSVLIVDDHAINRRAIELILTPLGCDTQSAADGLEALRLCAADTFDVIFMDVRMPELDGRETTRRLRAGHSPNVVTPVIAVTADTAPDDIAACMAAGMTYFVSKPLTPASLLGALTQVLASVADDQDTEATQTEASQTVAA